MPIDCKSACGERMSIGPGLWALETQEKPALHSVSCCKALQFRGRSWRKWRQSFKV